MADTGTNSMDLEVAVRQFQDAVLFACLPVAEWRIQRIIEGNPGGTAMGSLS
jgi:hypothetical protein